MTLERYNVGPCLAFMQFPLDPAAPALGGNQAPPGCVSLVVQVRGGAIRVRLDGQAPDEDTGHVVEEGTTVDLQLPLDQYPNAYFACASALPVTLVVHFFAAK